MKKEYKIKLTILYSNSSYNYYFYSDTEIEDKDISEFIDKTMKDHKMYINLTIISIIQYKVDDKVIERFETNITKNYLK
jgi:hypothetical protein